MGYSSLPHGSQGPHDLHVIVNSEHLHHQQVICAQGLSMLLKQLGLSLCHHAVPQSKGVPIFTQTSFIGIFKITKKKRTLNMFYIYFFICENLTNEDFSSSSVSARCLSLGDPEYSSPSEAGSVFMESILCC
jgi:hypothetical protein